jgi:mono/diheme cytochrome c family protein
MNYRFLLVGFVLSLGLVFVAQSEVVALAESPKLEAKHRQGYVKEVQPVFTRNCTGCHTARNGKGGLNLTNLDGLLKGSMSGQVIEYGNSGNSTLYQMIQQGAQKHMPPKKQLKDREIEAIMKWIDSLPTS